MLILWGTFECFARGVRMPRETLHSGTTSKALPLQSQGHGTRKGISFAGGAGHPPDFEVKVNVRLIIFWVTICGKIEKAQTHLHAKGSGLLMRIAGDGDLI